MEFLIVALLILVIIINIILFIKIKEIKPDNTIKDILIQTKTQTENLSENVKEKLENNNKILENFGNNSNEKLDKISEKLNNNLLNLNKNISQSLTESDKQVIKELTETRLNMKEDLNAIDKNIKDSLNNITKENSVSQKEVNESLKNGLLNLQKSNEEKLNQVKDDLNIIDKHIKDSLNDITKENASTSREINDTLKQGLIDLQKSNEEKLNQIQSNVNEKLDKSLNERLDSSFEKIGSQLSELYKSLGELGSMQAGINNLNKTLTNVKTRGTWGEIQLQDIIAETMQPNQYERNVKTNKGNNEDLVEFVIKIPSKDDKGEVLLPIDSKFPTDMYLSVIDASESGDKDLLDKATRGLEQRIKEEARKIRDKYINPPLTTDFAIMFLPTESMYAEVLRINGLAEYCQNNYKIIISGPSTITALLNSLRIGFANLTLNKKTQEIKKVLEAVKTQYARFGEDITKAQDRIDKASKSIEDIKKRSDSIQSKMKNIDTIEVSEAEKLLGIEENNEYD